MDRIGDISLQKLVILSAIMSLGISGYIHICTQSVSLVVYYMTFIKKSYPFMVHPLLPVPRSYRNLGVIPG